MGRIRDSREKIKKSEVTDTLKISVFCGIFTELARSYLKMYQCNGQLRKGSRDSVTAANDS